jgi:hypothetical protein
MAPESRQEAVRRADKLALGAAFALGAILSAFLFVDFLRPAEVQLAVFTLHNDLRFFNAEISHGLSGHHYSLRVDVDPHVRTSIVVDGFYKRGQRVNGTVKFCPVDGHQLEFRPSSQMKASLDNGCFVVEDPGVAYYVSWDKYGIGVYAKDALTHFDVEVSRFARASFVATGNLFEEGLVFGDAEPPSYPEVTGIDFATYDGDANYFEEGLTFVEAEKKTASAEK